MENLMVKETYRLSFVRPAIGRPRIMILLSLGLSIAVIVACSALPSLPSPAGTETPEAVRTSFPKETATIHIEPTVLLAEIIGKLNIVDGCARILDRADNVSRLLVWPPGYKVRIEKDTVGIIVGDGSGNRTEVLLHDGEMVFLVEEKYLNQTTNNYRTNLPIVEDPIGLLVLMESDILQRMKPIHNDSFGRKTYNSYSHNLMNI